MYDLKVEENETPQKKYKNLEKPNQTQSKLSIFYAKTTFLSHLWSQRILALDGTGKEGSLRLLSL